MCLSSATSPAVSTSLRQLARSQTESQHDEATPAVMVDHERRHCSLVGRNDNLVLGDVNNETTMEWQRDANPISDWEKTKTHQQDEPWVRSWLHLA